MQEGGGLLVLGAWRGLNPGMGWLLAVATGLQGAREPAVWRALPPMAVGHALAVARAVTVAAVLGHWIALEPVRWIVAGHDAAHCRLPGGHAPAAVIESDTRAHCRPKL